MRKIIILFSILVTLASQSFAADNSKLVVGMECNYAPFNWTQTNKTANAVALPNGISYCDGYDVQIAKIIAQKLKRTLVIRPNPVFEALLMDAQVGKIDLIIAGMTDTPKRRQAIDFTNVYYKSDLVLVVQKNGKYAKASSLTDFSGAKVAAQIGTFHDDVIKQIPKVNHAVALQSFPLLTLALNSNTLDAFVAENAVAIAIVNSNPKLSYISFKNNKGFKIADDEVTVSIGLAKGKTELLNSINKVLAEITPEQREKIMTAAISRQPSNH